LFLTYKLIFTILYLQIYNTYIPAIENAYAYSIKPGFEFFKREESGFGFYTGKGWLKTSKLLAQIYKL